MPPKTETLTSTTPQTTGVVIPAEVFAARLQASLLQRETRSRPGCEAEKSQSADSFGDNSYGVSHDDDEAMVEPAALDVPCPRPLPTLTDLGRVALHLRFEAAVREIIRCSNEVCSIYDSAEYSLNTARVYPSYKKLFDNLPTLCDDYLVLINKTK
jgi:hypothetical protein